jgi:hypothetical protein
MAWIVGIALLVVAALWPDQLSSGVVWLTGWSPKTLVGLRILLAAIGCGFIFWAWQSGGDR